MEGFVSNPALQIVILQQSARTAAFGEPGDGVSDPADLSKSRTDGSFALFQLICAVRSIGGFGLGIQQSGPLSGPLLMRHTITTLYYLMIILKVRLPLLGTN